MAVDERALTAGLDALEVPVAPQVSRGRALWRAAWPKLLAIAIVLGVLAVPHLDRVEAVATRSRRPPTRSRRCSTTGASSPTRCGPRCGVGSRATRSPSPSVSCIGAAVARIPVLRAAIGSMITGLQTMPSVAWYPLALLLFKLSEGAIFFVVVIGAAPSIANGLINGVDNISPVLLRAGKVLGAKRLDSFRYVILPAALPSFVGGLKQGWAFAWRSLLAGEIIGGIAGYSLGQQLATTATTPTPPGVQAVMIVLFTIGVLIDVSSSATLERKIRKRYGLVDAAAT